MKKILKRAALGAAVFLAGPAALLAGGAFAGGAFADDGGAAPPAPALGAGEQPAAPAGPKPAAPATETKAAEWYADFDKAVEAAKAQKKDLLVDFTGSDWCIWCKRLNEEVFEQAEFQAQAPKDFILVALDFPQDPEILKKVPNAARNQELMKQHKVEGFPTVLLMTADGEVLARTGYAEGGATPYLANVAKIRTAGKDALAASAALETEYAAAKDDAKAAVVSKAIAHLEKVSGGPTARLAAIARHGSEIDPDNKSGLKLASLKALFASHEAGETDHADARKLDPKNENGLLERVLEAAMVNAIQAGDGVEEFIDDTLALAKTGNLKNPEVYVAVLANAAGVSQQVPGQADKGKEIAKILKEKGPQDNPRLTKFLAQILGEAAPAGGHGHDHGDDDDDEDEDGDEHEGHEGHEKK